jgi:flagellar hook-length control protein FliK
MAKLNGGNGTGEENSGFKEMLEQGVQLAKGEATETAATKQSMSIKRIAGFETHAEFTDQASNVNLEARSEAEKQELIDAAGESGLELSFTAETAAVAADVSASKNLDGAANSVAEDSVQSIVNTLTPKSGMAVNASADNANSSEPQLTAERVSANIAGSVKAAAKSGNEMNAAQIAAAGQANGLSPNFVFSQRVSNDDVRRVGFDPEMKSALRDVVPGFSKGERSSVARQPVGEFAGIKNTSGMGEGGVENRSKNKAQPSVNRAASPELSVMAGTQATGQVAHVSNDAPPPVKDQVLDRLGPEIRSMHKAESTSAAQASGVAAVNRNVISLQLYPIGLGRVQAHLTKDGDGVKIDLVVESRQTLDLLNADIDALKTSMRALGASEGNINITLGRNSNNANQDGAMENGDLSNSDNAMAQDSDADGSNKRDPDSDIDSRLAALQSASDNERVGYDSSRIII